MISIIVCGALTIIEPNKLLQLNNSLNSFFVSAVLAYHSKQVLGLFMFFYFIMIILFVKKYLFFNLWKNSGCEYYIINFYCYFTFHRFITFFYNRTQFIQRPCVHSVCITWWVVRLKMMELLYNLYSVSGPKLAYCLLRRHQILLFECGTKTNTNNRATHFLFKTIHLW